MLSHRIHGAAIRFLQTGYHIHAHTAGIRRKVDKDYDCRIGRMGLAGFNITSLASSIHS